MRTLYKKHFRKNVGFTMIELVIALFVLSVAITGVYNAFSIMVVATSQMSDRFTAAYLAQEGIEIVRNIRDNNWLQGNDWNNGLSSANMDCSNGCEADYKTGTLAGTGLIPYGGSGNYLYIEHIDNNNFYSYQSNGTETKFKRKITITPDGDYVLRVSVDVFWDEKTTIFDFDQQNSITAEDYLYNWY